MTTKIHFLSIVCTGKNWQKTSMQFTDNPKKVTCLRCQRYVKSYLRNMRLFKGTGASL